VTEEVRSAPLREWVAPLRVWMWIAGLVLWVLALAPPWSTWSGHYQFVQAIQYATFAFCIPSLLVAGAPWRRIGLARYSTVQMGPDGAKINPRDLKLIDRVALSRSSSTHQRRTITFAMVFIALTLFWRVAPVVDFLIRHEWLTFIESLSLVGVGTLLFTDLIESPPLTPGATRPYRISIATGVMWSVWVAAYLEAMSHNSWYHGFHHVAGQGISLAADQQLSAGFLWLLSAVVFVPTIFWNLIHWLQSDEDPNAEMGKLLREERTRGFFGTD
jgi:cytochrome c oxidase assembly factor CtaG